VTNIARAVTATAALVGHASGSSDSSLHLPSLIAHLSAIVSSVATDANDAATNAAKLPIPLKKMLVTLHPHFRAVEHIAESLCALFGRLAAFEGATTPATSCAICILALEAEARKTLPALSELSSALGVRFGVSGSTVQARYRTACEVASEWTAELPWAARYTRDVPRRGKMQRAKEGRRAVVAQYLKDAVELQEATWLKKVAGVGQPVQEAEVEQPAARLQSGKRELVQDSIQVSHARKRRKPTPHDADVASTFLLSQGAGPATCHRVTKTALFISDAAMQLSRLNSLPAHMLTTDTSLLSLKHPPTRLQLLISSRGSSDMVLDDELFDAGELDGLLRTDEERERYMHTVDWLDYVPAYAMPGSTLSSGGRTRKESSAKGIERINMDRLAQLFGEDLSDEKGEDFGAWGMDDLVTLDDEKDEDTSAAEMGGGHRYPAADVEDEVVDEWRPASPGGDGGDWIDF
jgi:transcription factor IIIB subunit 2